MSAAAPRGPAPFSEIRTAFAGAGPPLHLVLARLGFGLAQGLTLLATAFIAGRAGGALAGGDPDGASLGLLATLLLSSTLLSFAQSAISKRLALTLETRLRDALFHHLHTVSPAAVRAHEPGDLLSRLTDDVGALVQFATTSIPGLAPNILMGCGALVLMFTADPAIALACAVAVGALILLMRLAARALRPLALAQAEAGSRTLETARALLAMLPVTKAFGVEDTARRQHGLALATYETASRRLAIYTLSLQPISWLLAGLGLLALIAASAHGWLGSSQSAGAAVALVGYALIMARGAGGIAAFYGALQRASVAATRIADIRRLAPEAEGSTLPRESRTVSLRFEDVFFAYDEKTPLLEGVDFTLNPGTVTALTGPNGAGKSTIAALALRFERPRSGTIFLGETPLDALTTAALRKLVAWVPQETALLADTVHANIAWARPGATRDAVENAARLATAHDFIDALPAGYDTRIGLEGHRLSGGERQRLALARAILADTPLLILDEATAMFAPQDDDALFDALASWLKGRTVLVITHRERTLRRADRVLRLDGGRVH